MDMNLKKLASRLIPDKNLLPPEEYEKIYPERDIEKGAEVTRLAPSPTGFIHLGNLYSFLFCWGGVFILLKMREGSQKTFRSSTRAS